jgi:hypothetical protein
MEPNVEAWREIRGRADSIANAVFLLGGGAFSLSIATLLGSRSLAGVTTESKHFIICSWGLLAYSVVAALVVKFLLVVQAYKALSSSSHFACWHRVTTYANWCFGISGLVSFIAGVIVLCIAAARLLMQHP